MPLIVAALAVAVLTGLWLPRRAALAAAAALRVVTLVTFVWAVSDDGQGNDPWGLVLVAVAASGFAQGVVAFLSLRRLRRQVAT